MANNERLDEILSYIESHPDEWNQDVYGALSNRQEVADKTGIKYSDINNYSTSQVVRQAIDSASNICKSAFCFAGHAVVAYTDYRPSVADLIYGWYEVKPDRDTYAGTVSGIASNVLDLTPDQAEVLFDGFNGLVTLKAVVEAIKEDPTIDFDQLYAIQSRIQPNEYADVDDE